MDHTPRAVLRTARLVLRPVQNEDARPMIAGVGQLRVSRYLVPVPHPYGPQDFSEYLAFTRPGIDWSIMGAEGHSGAIALGPGLGFWIAPARQGRGYVTEAALAVLAAHFADPLADAVVSGYFADNAASARVHYKLGFEKTADAEVFCRALGQSRPFLRQSLTREAYAAACPLVIETPRLLLRPLDPQRDLAALHRIGGNPDVARMMQSLKPDWTLAEAGAFLDRSLWRGCYGFRLAICRKDGPLIGTIGIGGTPASTAYFIDPAYQGQGHATEALRAFLPAVMQRFDLRTVEAGHFQDNPASRHGLLKAGFVPISTALGRSAGRAQGALVVNYRLNAPLPG